MSFMMLLTGLGLGWAAHYVRLRTRVDRWDVQFLRDVANDIKHGILSAGVVHQSQDLARRLESLL